MEDLSSLAPALYAVTGNPVLHSKSPQMINAAFQAARYHGRYIRLAAVSAREALDTARQVGIRGLNVTAPFKEEMFRLTRAADGSTKKLSAVNTVLLSDSASAPGFNTDVDGVALALRSAGVVLSGSQALVLGAGGAARAAVQALLREGAMVTVANRTVEKAAVLGADFGVEFCGIDEGALKEALPRAQVIVSTISAAERIVPAELLTPNHVLLDGYYAEESMLLKDARAAGAEVLDGREWLLYQGAKAFEHFTGQKADIEAMRSALFNWSSPRKKSVALIGSMGAGKSSAAAELSKLLKLPLCGLDEEIERREGISVGEIFALRGEAGFRQSESERLKELAGREACILSCGGGAVLREENRSILRDNFITVWLWASPETCLERLKNHDNRPLLSGPDRAEVFRDLMSKRMPLYASTADLMVSTEGRSPDQIAGLMRDEIHKAITH